jgi:hypothetical protein
MMSEQQNIAIAKKLLEGIAGGQDPDAIAALFDNNLMFEIQGDDGVLPWIGRKTGRQAIADFIRDVAQQQGLLDYMATQVADWPRRGPGRDRQGGCLSGFR